MSHVHSPRTDEFGGHLWMKLIISFPVVLLSFIFLLSKRKAKSVSHADTPTLQFQGNTPSTASRSSWVFSSPLPGQKRPPLPPQPGNDLYEDPIVDTGGAQWGGSGMIPDDGYGEEPGGIYGRLSW